MLAGVIFVICCVTDLRCKEVINKKDGCRLGHVCDVEVDTCCGKVVAIIIYGRGRFFGRENDIRICWENIDVIGDDIILVCIEPCQCACPRKRGAFFDTIFR